MSDLISRSALIEALLQKKSLMGASKDGLHPISMEVVIEYIEGFPTAYNMDKVIEELEEKLSKKHRLFLREDRDEIRYFYEMQILKEAIEIVRKDCMKTTAPAADPEPEKPLPAWKQAFLRTFLGRN